MTAAEVVARILGLVLALAGLVVAATVTVVWITWGGA